MLSSADYEVLCRFEQQSFSFPLPPEIPTDRVYSLADRELLKKVPYLKPSDDPVVPKIYIEWYTINPAGVDSLSEFRRNDEQQRKDAREKRRDNVKAWIIPCFAAVFASGVTLFVEHVIIPLFR